MLGQPATILQTIVSAPAARHDVALSTLVNKDGHLVATLLAFARTTSVAPSLVGAFMVLAQVLHQPVYAELAVDGSGAGFLGVVPDINRGRSLEQAMFVPVRASAVFPRDAAKIAELGTAPATIHAIWLVISSARTLPAGLTYVMWLQPVLSSTMFQQRWQRCHPS